MPKNNKSIFYLLMTTLLFVVGCTSNTSFESGTSAAPAGVVLSPQFTTEFYSGSTLIYSDSPSIGRAQMVSGETYSMVIRPLNEVSATYTVRLVNRDNGQTLLSRAMTAGAPVDVVFPSADDYQVSTVATPTRGTPVTKAINIAVACEEATFSVNENNISVAASGSNLFTYSSAGVAPDATNYECAWDFNGDGILDRNFASCGTRVQAISNHVGARTLTVAVRDVSCNTHVLAKRTVNMPEPIAGAGINLIRGDVSQPGDSTNARTNLTHSSTNNAGLELALCDYNDDAGVWTISGLNNYYSPSQALSLPTSRDHGMRLSISGAPRNGVTTGPINTANARISNTRLMTDAQSDGLPQFTFQTSTCNLTNFTLTAAPVTGTPCSGSGGTLVEPGATVIAEGQFDCSNLRANENASLPPVGVDNGRFFCIFHIGDSCIGGGGGGGGGIPPIRF